ncbi:hypothetical protein SFRURICE_005098 [Spodoptera frugiperda]|nr:hypothetical protein SFRURICE_005098 [Spodoptera frugiperda]
MIVYNKNPPVKIKRPIPSTTVKVHRQGSILYIENIERINSRGCYWIDIKPKYFYSTERELNSSSSIEGSPLLLWALPYLGPIDIYKMSLSELLKIEK